ncbi:hypothetical protein [Cypionkella sp.]|uniref:calcium-binding protein n=1 Tax=Cypionkella sp. TaxID=2811411 RepID=UPI002AB89378|nr:hypothetical protein [Cypionkella sp.]MDZ4395122.1 hypothetical protein [Cypionkella sp.]
MATVRADAVVAVDTGAKIRTLSGNDSVIGGAGNDWIDMGTGADLVLASAGDDTINGGQGVDRLVMGLHSSQVLVTTIDGQCVVLSALGRSFISGIEEFEFIDGIKSVTSKPLAVVSASNAAVGAASTSIDVTSDSMADSSVQGVRLTGRTDLDFVGNDNGNRVIGNAGSNIIFGEAGDDGLHGYAGHDLLNGGLGNDSLSGGLGQDTLNGGAGKNSIIGGAGADVFIASNGINTVHDFSTAQHDSLVFFGFNDDDLAESLSHWSSHTLTSADDFAISEVMRAGVSYLTLTSDLGDSLILRNVDTTALHDYLLN